MHDMHGFGQFTPPPSLPRPPLHSKVWPDLVEVKASTHVETPILPRVTGRCHAPSKGGQHWPRVRGTPTVHHRLLLPPSAAVPIACWLAWRPSWHAPFGLIRIRSVASQTWKWGPPFSHCVEHCGPYCGTNEGAAPVSGFRSRDPGTACVLLGSWADDLQNQNQVKAQPALHSVELILPARSKNKL